MRGESGQIIELACAIVHQAYDDLLSVYERVDKGIPSGMTAEEEETAVSMWLGREYLHPWHLSLLELAGIGVEPTEEVRAKVLNIRRKWVT